MRRAVVRGQIDSEPIRGGAGVDAGGVEPGLGIQIERARAGDAAAFTQIDAVQVKVEATARNGDLRLILQRPVIPVGGTVAGGFFDARAGEVVEDGSVIAIGLGQRRAVGGEAEDAVIVEGERLSGVVPRAQLRAALPGDSAVVVEGGIVPEFFETLRAGDVEGAPRSQGDAAEQAAAGPPPRAGPLQLRSLAQPAAAQFHAAGEVVLERACRIHRGPIDEHIAATVEGRAVRHAVRAGEQVQRAVGCDVEAAGVRAVSVPFQPALEHIDGARIMPAPGGVRGIRIQFGERGTGLVVEVRVHVAIDFDEVAGSVRGESPAVANHRPGPCITSGAETAVTGPRQAAFVDEFAVIGQVLVLGTGEKRGCACGPRQFAVERTAAPVEHAWAGPDALYAVFTGNEAADERHRRRGEEIGVQIAGSIQPERAAAHERGGAAKVDLVGIGIQFAAVEEDVGVVVERPVVPVGNALAGRFFDATAEEIIKDRGQIAILPDEQIPVACDAKDAAGLIVERHRRAGIALRDQGAAAPPLEQPVIIQHRAVVEILVIRAAHDRRRARGICPAAADPAARPGGVVRRCQARHIIGVNGAAAEPQTAHGTVSVVLNEVAVRVNHVVLRPGHAVGRPVRRSVPVVAVVER